MADELLTKLPSPKLPEMVILRNGKNTQQRAVDEAVKMIAYKAAFCEAQSLRFAEKAKNAVHREERQMWSERATLSAQRAKALRDM